VPMQKNRFPASDGTQNKFARINSRSIRIRWARLSFRRACASRESAQHRFTAADRTRKTHHHAWLRSRRLPRRSDVVRSLHRIAARPGIGPELLPRTRSQRHRRTILSADCTSSASTRHPAQFEFLQNACHEHQVLGLTARRSAVAFASVSGRSIADNLRYQRRGLRRRVQASTICHRARRCILFLPGCALALFRRSRQWVGLSPIIVNAPRALASAARLPSQNCRPNLMTASCPVDDAQIAARCNQPNFVADPLLEERCLGVIGTSHPAVHPACALVDIGNDACSPKARIGSSTSAVR